MIACPQPGCSGYLDEGCCTFCSKTPRLSDVLHRFPAPEWVRLEQETREDLALRTDQ